MRTHTVAVAILVGVVMVSTRIAQAQSTPERRVVVSLGIIDVMHGISGDSQLGLYPEIEVFASLYRSDEGGITLGGSLYVAGWSDGGPRHVPCPHCVTYSRRSAIGGARAAARLDRFLLGPLSFVAGVSYHSTWATYVAGSNGYGEPQNYREALFAVETGVRLEIPISRRISFEPRGHVFLPVPFEENRPDFARYVWAGGFSYSL